MRVEEPVLIDTSAIVAFADPQQAEHDACGSVFDALPTGKAFLCWPVMTETVYMLRRRSDSVARLFGAVSRGVFPLLGLSRFDLPEMESVISKYHDQEVDRADAAIVHLANREKHSHRLHA